MDSLRPRAKAALQHLLYTASETLHDGTYYLDGNKRRCRAVKEAEGAFHEFTKSVNNGLLNDMRNFEASLERIYDVLTNLAVVGIEPTTLMVHRDYASTNEHVVAQKRKRRPFIRLPSQPRLIWTAKTEN